MRSARLSLALQSGLFALPARGDVVVFGAAQGDDLSWARPAQTVLLTGFKPDHDHFAAQGWQVVTGGDAVPPCDLAVVLLPRYKAAARDMLALAALRLRPGGQIVLDGQKTDGIAAILSDLQALGADLGPALAKAHGKLAVFAPPQGLADWLDAPRAIAGGFITRAGVFSADAPDPASQLLAAALPLALPAHMADLGAGWGYLAQAVLARPGPQSLDLVEADHSALTCARANIPDPRARFHWADATRYRPARPWDGVVMNPPFHNLRSLDAQLGLAFIRAAHAGLAAQGQIWLVANRHLPYMPLIRSLFREVQEMGQDPRFRLIHAAQPAAAPKG
jgi:16S rRNA (guanine1207-N2)-methyltransferase